MGVSVTKQGYQWKYTDATKTYQWVTESNTYIGFYNYAGGVRYHKMTAFTVTPTEDMKSITLTFTMEAGDIPAKWSMTKPASYTSSGTSVTLVTGANTIAISGSYKANTSYTIWVWGTAVKGNYIYKKVTSCSAIGVRAGLEAYIWVPSSTTKTSESSIAVSNTYRQLQQVSTAFNNTFKVDGIYQNIVGIGYNDASGSGPLYYSAACIPIQSASFASASLSISATIYINSSGVKKFRWAVSTLPPASASVYANTHSAVSESKQLASGTFTISGTVNTWNAWELPVNVSIPSGTTTYLYLWAYGNDSGAKAYGNFHIKGDIVRRLRSAPISDMQFVKHDAYIYTGSKWEPMTPQIYGGSSWLT